MKPSFILRQLLALVSGLAIIVALFWSLLLLQFVPVFIRGGFPGLQEHVARVATADVPPQQRETAITRMYEALAASALVGCILYKTIGYLQTRLDSHHKTCHRS